MTGALFTIYLFIVATLLASAGMTLWERKTRPERRGTLETCAVGYLVLAAGCVVATARSYMPGISGAALSNLVILSGYMLVLDGVAAVGGRRHRALSLGLLVVMAAVWALAGPRWPETVWLYASGVPIVIVCALTAWEAWRAAPLQHLRSRKVLVAVLAFHGLVYALRVTVLPLAALRYGPALVAVSSTITMYAGVLYSVVLPMAMLAVVREEADAGLVRLAQTDHLTNLGNRRWFFAQGGTTLALVPGVAALLAFDIDHFKSINDRFGHATGDEVIASFARILRETVGTKALLARIGGEEFAALLPGCDAADARRIGNAVIAEFADSAVLSRSGVAVSATVSVGLAERFGSPGTQASGESAVAALLAEADAALYRAKAKGRNRIEPALAVPGVAAA